MKKIVLLFCLALTAFSVSCTSKNKAASAKVKVGSTVQKNVTIAGETVVRNHKISEYKEYDQFGRVIYIKYSNSEYKYDYDESGTKRHAISFLYSKKDSEIWDDLDSKGNVIHEKSSDGTEAWYEWNEDNKLIYMGYGDGNEARYEIKGNITEVHFTGSDGYTSTSIIDNGTEYIEYDDKGNVIHFENSGGHEEFYEYTFWPDGTIKTKITYEKI